MLITTHSFLQVTSGTGLPNLNWCERAHSAGSHSGGAQSPAGKDTGGWGAVGDLQTWASSSHEKLFLKAVCD